MLTEQYFDVCGKKKIACFLVEVMWDILRVSWVLINYYVVKLHMAIMTARLRSDFSETKPANKKSTIIHVLVGACFDCVMDCPWGWILLRNFSYAKQLQRRKISCQFWNNTTGFWSISMYYSKCSKVIYAAIKNLYLDYMEEHLPHGLTLHSSSETLPCCLRLGKWWLQRGSLWLWFSGYGMTSEDVPESNFNEFFASRKYAFVCIW